MKKIVGLVLALLVASATYAQQPFSTQSLTAMSAGAACPDPGCMIVDVQGLATAGVQITGTWTQTLQFEQSIDKATWATWSVTPNAGGAAVTSTAANGLWFGSLAGARWIRVRVSAFTSGTAVVSTQSAIGRLAAPVAPVIVAAGRVTGQTAAAASIATYTVGAADGSFTVSGYVLATVRTAYSFNLAASWTDEASVPHTLGIFYSNSAMGVASTLSNADANGLYPMIPMEIRAKAGTAITILTTGTFTTVTYNADGVITRLF